MGNYRGVKLWEAMCSSHRKPCRPMTSKNMLYITQSNDCTLLIISISPNTALSAPQKHCVFSQKHCAWSKKRSRVSQWTKIKRVHNSHKPLESRTLIYQHNKNYLFPYLASFWLKINPVYQKQQQNVHRNESFYHALCKVRGTDCQVTLHKILHKSFHPFAPLKVTLAFSDQGPEYS